ncbi:S8 family peptidase [Paraburkholderia tropica]|uniref:S8 family peptidase n=1 Tax=Paraburkholderia tropica TaxID=92647 RepID=UPI002AB71F43|nr:S8/S53 family peptidase [Paraburkholderia tropica]
MKLHLNLNSRPKKMTLSFNDSQTLVAFRDFFDLSQFSGYNSPEEKATSRLSRISEFVRVVRKFRYLNAALVETTLGGVDEFNRKASRLDEVEFCNRNYLTEPACIIDTLNREHRIISWPDRDSISPHFLNRPKTEGERIKIALLDTGIAPHPFLPAMSFKESLRRTANRAPTMLDVEFSGLCNTLAGIEDSFANPYTSSGDSAAFLQSIYDEVEKAANLRWNRWETETSVWLQNGRPLARPQCPDLRGLFGMLRVVNPNSRNMLDDTPDVFDRDGHGTEMAGLIAAVPPVTTDMLNQIQHLEDQAQVKFDLSEQIKDLMPSLRGFSPRADLYVFKCLEGRQSDKATVAALIFATEKCINNGVDYACIGVRLTAADYGDVLLLSRAFDNLHNENCVAIAPAGNGDKVNGARIGRGQLDLPAAFSNVLAITAVEGASGAFRLAPYSNYIDPHPSVNGVGEVAFCAMGTGDAHKPLTTAPGYGFVSPTGTSISAAIAAGIFVSTASEEFDLNFKREYGLYMGAQGQIDKDDVRRAIEALRPDSALKSAVLTKLRQRADRSMFHGPSPDLRFGYGFIRR